MLEFILTYYAYLNILKKKSIKFTFLSKGLFIPRTINGMANQNPPDFKELEVSKGADDITTVCAYINSSIEYWSL